MGQKLSELRGLLVEMGGEENINKLASKKYRDEEEEEEEYREETCAASSLNGNNSDHFENMYSNTGEGIASGSEEINGNVVPASDTRPCSHASSSTSKATGARKRAKDTAHSNSLKRNTLRTMSLVNGKRSHSKTVRGKDGSASKKRNAWVLKFNCAKLKAGSSSSCLESDIPETHIVCDSCVCTGYRRTEEHHLGAGIVFEADTTTDTTTRRELCRSVSEEASSPPRSNPVIDLSKFNPEDFPIEDCDERARLERAREIAEGVEPPPGFQPGQHIQLVCPELTLDNLTMLFQTHFGLHTAALTALSQLDISLPSAVQRFHTQVDYVHCLVPDLLPITLCSFYWGKMDRYEAERLLEGKPEGTFLLRDSAQEDFLFSVTFRKYERALHARIEQWNHRFTFDPHDPGVFASPTVCGLVEHYKDPSCCMFFEPMLTIPLHRTFPFPLQHLCRAVVCSRTNYDSINQLHLPKALKGYLKEYHYKQRVRVRLFDQEH